jgi:hypothetical protein
VAILRILGTYNNMLFVRLINLPISEIACRKLSILGYSALKDKSRIDIREALLVVKVI